jgi:hypothetical protein
LSLGSQTFSKVFVQRTLALVVGFMGLTWGVLALPQSRSADQFRDIESSLLRSEIINRTALAQMLEGQSLGNLSACDTHSQRALLLMGIPLAEAALRSGDSQEFDERVRSLEARARQILGCTPRESFVWLLLFNLEVLHGQLNEQSFNLLAMSYETSPNEAWISIRRIIVAVPLVLLTSGSLRKAILFEFQQLIRNGFVDNAARSFSLSSETVRSALQAQIDQLSPPQQKAFSEALQKLRSS